MNDFATEEYVKKNIRVRPVSSVSGQREDRSEYMSRHGIGEDNAGEDDRAFNLEAVHDIEAERWKVKKIKDDYEAKLM